MRALEIEIGIVTALIIVIVGQVIYHLVAKSVSNVLRPWELIGAAYFLGFVIIVLVGSYFDQVSIQSMTSSKNVAASGLIALAILFIELGYLYSYRNGLAVSVGAISVLAITTIILIPIAKAFYNEPIHLSRIIGFLIAVAGVWLMQKNPKW